MDGIQFILMAILGLALVYQSPAIILGCLLWILNFPRHPIIKQNVPPVSSFPYIFDQVKLIFHIWFETWCPHHKSNKFGYDGLYYSSHTADTHDAWRQDKSGFTSCKKREHDPDKNKLKKSLQISESVKTTLCTNFCCSEEDLDKILADDSLN